MGSDPTLLLNMLQPLKRLSFDRFSVASNPLAKSRMSAMAMSMLIRRQIGINCTLHCTVRDGNRLGMQSLLWGAKALGVHSILAMTGDLIASGDCGRATKAGDFDVLDLIRMAQSSELLVGVVLDASGTAKGLDNAIRRLESKVSAGARYVVTQPVFEEAAVEMLHHKLSHLEISKIMGILPLRSARHAEFLHRNVSGVTIPAAIRERMNRSANGVAEGIDIARKVIAHCRSRFQGVCIMPAFNRFDVVPDIISP